VLEEMLSYYRTYRANVHRGFSRLSRIASEKYDEAHDMVSSFIGAGKDEVSFTLNATYGVNLVALALNLGRGDKVVVSELEHHSNILPWLRLKRRGVSLEVVEASSEGVLSPEAFENAIDGKTRLVSVTHISNSVGALQPVEEIGKIARERGCLFLVDAAQSVPHKRVDVRRLGCDFLVFSGHKMLAPTGTGVLYIRGGLQGTLESPFVGGGTASEVGFESFNSVGGYAGWEAGTPNIGGSIGLAKAVLFLRKVGLGKIDAHVKKLSKKTVRGLRSIQGVSVYGPKTPHAGIVSFNVEGLSPHDLSLMLDEKNIVVRSGFHCAVPYVKKLSPDGVVRASFYLYNTPKEVERFLSVVEDFAREFSP
jgi:cysteine desulfurase/selenocysteine lyase